MEKILKKKNSMSVFINKKATELKNLCLNEEWFLIELRDNENIYNIYIEGEKSKWIVKVYKKQKFLENESKNLNALKNVSGVPKILSVGISDNLNYIVMSEAPGIDLFEYMEQTSALEVDQLRDIAKKILSILVNIHKHKIVHQDIKPENIIYDAASKEITIIDFEERHTCIYCSPEQIKNKNITKKTDVWSVGITLYFLAAKANPFADEKEILNSNLTCPKDWDPDFKDFLGCLINRDISTRYSAKEALDHVWITNDD